MNFTLAVDGNLMSAAKAKRAEEYAVDGIRAAVGGPASLT